MKNNKVLLVSSNSSGRGGGERYLVFLSQGLLNLGFDVHILVSTVSYMDGWAKSLTAIGATVHRLPLKGLVQRKLRFISAMLDKNQIKAIRNFCIEISPDAILINQQYDEDGIDYIAGAIQSKCKKIASVMHMPMTANKNLRPLGSLRGGILRAWYSKHPFQLILVSEGAQKEFEAYYSKILPTYVVNNAIPLEDLSATSSTQIAKPPSKKMPIIGFVGQLVSQKNLVRLIEAWKLLKIQGYETKLLIVGDGPERENIERLLSTTSDINLWAITGWASEPETQLNEIDIFAMSSDFEGLPLSLLEAAARGIKCVVTPFNGATDVAKNAPWVHVTNDFSPHSICNKLIEILKDWDNQPNITSTELQSFRNYFSINRMAKDVAKILEISPCE